MRDYDITKFGYGLDEEEKIHEFSSLGEYNKWQGKSDRILTTPDDLKYFLETFYDKEDPSQCKLEQLNLIDNSSLRAKFYIPPYQKTNERLAGGHVSANPLNEIIIKGCYLLGGHLLKQGDISFADAQGGNRKFNYERDFHEIASSALYKGDNRKFKYIGKEGESYIFDFYLDNLKVKGGFLSTTIGYDGLVAGKSEVVIGLKSLDGFYEKSYAKYREKEKKRKMI